MTQLFEFLGPQGETEIVLGLVAPVGTDTAQAIARLETSLRDLYKRKPKTWRLSDAVPDHDLAKATGDEAERLQSYMDGGDELRDDANAGDYVAAYTVSRIADWRATKFEKETLAPDYVHILNSLKHPDEVELLRRVYGPGFFLVAIHASEDRRYDFLQTECGMDGDQAKSVMTRDEADAKPLGQQTRATFHLADFFLDFDNSDWAFELSRFMELVFGNPHVAPSSEEQSMFLAYSASLRSSDLSRQVGALLASSENEVLAMGANEVPRYGGGQYWPSSQKDSAEPDGRDVVLGFDSNERERDRIIMEILSRFASKENAEADGLALAKEKLRGTGILDLTEFGRAVHAEMAALMAALRIGVSPRNGTMFVTTFPCHNCAKHIVAAGVERVIYIEPYPKSQAVSLHGDAITTKQEDQGKVRFAPFMGVGPRRFFDLFSLKLSSGRKLSRKHAGGNKREWQSESSSPRIPLSVMTYLQRETTIRQGVARLLSEKDE